MAEAAALAGLGWVASPVMKDLVAKSISYLGNDIAKDFEDLETTLLPQIRLTIKAAQHSPPDQKAELAKWLARMKNAYYDAEGILHELEYERLKRKAKGEVRLSSKLIIKPLAKFIGPVVKKASLLSPRKRELLQRLNKLKEVAAEAKNFRDLLKDIKKIAAAGANTESGDGIANNSRSDTSSLLTDKVFGRDGDRDEIINFLLDDGDRYSVVAVTGMGGAGKTTLAQYVYNNEIIKRNFGVKMWLCLSRNLNINERTKEMIECASGKECPNLRNLDALQNKLTETISKSESIIVVLDDVWYDNNNKNKVGEENQWENLLKPFIKFSSQGGTCKIIVTSRSSRLFPNALKPEKVIELRDLALDEFKSLLSYRAIVGLQINDEQLKKDLSKIVDQIAEKMSKSPLAAKVVGNQLRERANIRFWQATLENVNLSDTTEILLWSFYRLDVQLQRCFLFCSVFPKGINFSLKTFVPYWVALDFIQPSDDNRNVEDIGLEYCEIMVANSIFHLVDGRYIMHDLFHDLAENLSTGDCFRVTNDERKIPSTVQHVYLEVNNENRKKILSSMFHLSNLRTLILGNQFIDDISEIIRKISSNFRNLRVLDVSSTVNCKTLPRVIGDSRNLRLLDLRKSSIEELPDSVVQLYHLQFLFLPSSVRTLPTELSNLIKLRHIQKFNINGAYDKNLPPASYLGKLTSLQQLHAFYVLNWEGFELHQLGSLKEIGGCLRILNLDNVRNKNEAVEAMLIDKVKLKRIELVWFESDKNGSELEVIEALRPPANLEELSITRYRGSAYPTWLQEGCFTENIKCIELDRCNALTIIPPNFQQFCHCSKLFLFHLDALRELSTFPESLTRLSIIECPCLIFVRENELQVDENHSRLESGYFGRIFDQDYKNILDHELKSFEQTGSKENCAEQLQIMESAARHNEHLENLNLLRAWWCCHQQRMNFIFRCNTRANKLKLPSRLCILQLKYCCVSDGALSDCLSGMTALEKLYLEGIMTITTLPPTQVLKPLQSLRFLEIKRCWNLRSLGGLHALPHLENFVVDHCWHLEMESGYTSVRLPATLQSLTIRSCIVSQAIFNSDLPCLQDVTIEDCLTPRCLSFCQLTLLKSLTLVLCPHLLSIRGLESRTFIDGLYLLDLPNLVVESILESWLGCRELMTSSSVILNKFLLSRDFVPPETLYIKFCQQEVISFEKSDSLQSIKTLVFMKCKTLRLPETLSDFSTLKSIGFVDCQNISGLPELPSSVTYIEISGCPVLSKRCQPKGRDWHKIQYIQNKFIK